MRRKSPILVSACECIHWVAIGLIDKVEEEPEPEVDLSEFVRKQRLDDEAGTSGSVAVPKVEQDDDVRDSGSGHVPRRTID
jgi:hypothetical protein